jgi:hypothetical protein
VVAKVAAMARLSARRLVYCLVCVVVCWFFVLIGAAAYQIRRHSSVSEEPKVAPAVAVDWDKLPKGLMGGVFAAAMKESLLNPGEDDYTLTEISDADPRGDVTLTELDAVEHKDDVTLTEIGDMVTQGGEEEVSIGVVVLAHNRPEYLKPVLTDLLGLMNIDAVSVYVSMDHPPSFGQLTALVTEVSRELAVNVQVWEQTHDVTSHERPQWDFEQTGMFKIAAHVKKALAKGFANGHTHIILLEDDLVVAPDFLTLFLETAHLLTTDPSLLCVSAWHDNGLRSLVKDEERLFRTDFFPGLGWMLTRALWEELAPKWPTAATTGWDYWLRLSANSKGRYCIVPEVPRTQHIAKKGTSVKRKEANQFAKFGFAARSVEAQPHLTHISSPFSRYFTPLSYNSPSYMYFDTHSTPMLHPQPHIYAACASL